MTTFAIGRLTHRRWRLLERRAVAAHEQETLLLLKRLSATTSPLAEVELARGSTPGYLLDAVVGRHRLLMAGMPPTAATALEAAMASPTSRLSLVGAGRYGRAWWLAVAGESGTATVLGSHLRLLGRGGGWSDWTGDPAPTSSSELFQPLATVYS